MTKSPAYDVAIIGYGPTGATAANLLGRLGLKVVVIERDPDIYLRARAISIDEEVMRVWQSVGLSDRLQQDMLHGQPIAFVDAKGKPFIEWTIKPQGSGHPPQQFIYQPAVDTVLREGVERFANVELLLEHECLRVLNKSDEVELMLSALSKGKSCRNRKASVRLPRAVWPRIAARSTQADSVTVSSSDVACMRTACQVASAIRARITIKREYDTGQESPCVIIDHSDIPPIPERRLSGMKIMVITVSCFISMLRLLLTIES